jgi:hypothetical protein
MPNEKTHPIQWTEQPTGALVGAGSLWPFLTYRNNFRLVEVTWQPVHL